MVAGAAAGQLFLALSGHARMVAGAAARQPFLVLSGHARIRAAGRMNAGMPGGA